MKSKRLCPECGAALPAEESGSRCPSCLLRLALGDESESSSPAAGSAARSGDDTRSATTPASIRRIGEYDILGEIARGGMGVVYRAHRRDLNRTVALKRVASQKLVTPELLLRFQMETEAIAKLDHPNIVPLYEVGEHDGVQFFTMKLVEGGNLTEWLERIPKNGDSAPSLNRNGSNGNGSSERKSHVRDLIALMVKVCRSVHHAHQRGILHRDLKPGNILVDERGEPHVSDFGLAKILEHDSSITHAESIIGSPNYMAPEQANAKGQAVTTAADIYSLGAILYEVLTGEPPFKAGTPLETIHRVVSEEPRRPSTVFRGVDRDLESICLRCLEKEPSRRYDSADDLADDLDRWLKGMPVHARPITIFGQVTRWARRNPAVTIAAIVVIACLVVLAIGSTVAAARIAAAREETETLLGRSQAREAERLFEADRSADGLALLARVARNRPGDVDIAHRLASAMSHRQFAMLVRPPARYNFDVLDAVIIPDKGEIHSVTQDGTIHRWNWVSGEMVSPPFPSGERLLDARFSPGGEKVAVVTNDRRIKVWDLMNESDRGTVVHDIGIAEGSVGQVALSPDGLRLAAFALHSHLIHILDLETGEPVRVLTQAAEITGRCDFSADGSHLAVGLVDGRVMVWKVDSGAVTFLPERHEGYVTAVAFSPDGLLVASASGDQTARVWDLAAGNRFPWLAHHGNELTSVAFSSDGKQLITASWDSAVKVWEIDSGRLACEPLNHRWGVSGIATPVLPGLVCSIRSNELWLWRIRSAYSKPAAIHLSKGYSSLAFDPSGQRLVTGEANGTLRFWEVAVGEEIRAPIEHLGGLVCVKYHPAGESVVVAVLGSAAWIQKPGGGEAIRLPHDNWVRTAEFDITGARIVTASHDRTGRIWDARTGESIGPPLRHDDQVWHAAFSPNGKQVVTASRDGTACVWDAATGERLATLAHDSFVSKAGYSPRGRFIATVSYDWNGRLWRLDEDGLPLDVDHPLLLPHQAQVVCLDMSSDGRWMATASYDHTARVWNVETGESLPYLIQHSDPVVAVAFSPDGNRLATASRDRTARIWSVETGKPVTEPLRHTGVVWRIVFSSDGRSIATSSEDGTIKVWPLLRLKAGDSAWLAPLAEFASRRSATADGFNTMLDAAQLESRRALLEDLRDRVPLVEWFLKEPGIDP